jgi:hypothetical protein
LHRVLGVVHRTEDAVPVHEQLGSVLVGQQMERVFVACASRSDAHIVGRGYESSARASHVSG